MGIERPDPPSTTSATSRDSLMPSCVSVSDAGRRTGEIGVEDLVLADRGEQAARAEHERADRQPRALFDAAAGGCAAR